MAYDGTEYQTPRIETGDPSMDAYASHLDAFLASPEGEAWIEYMEDRFKSTSYAGHCSAY